MNQVVIHLAATICFYNNMIPFPPILYTHLPAPLQVKGFPSSSLTCQEFNFTYMPIISYLDLPCNYYKLKCLYKYLTSLHAHNLFHSQCASVLTFSTPDQTKEVTGVHVHVYTCWMYMKTFCKTIMKIDVFFNKCEYWSNLSNQKLIATQTFRQRWEWA